MEVLVVLAIMGLIMSLIGPRVLNYLTESKYKTAQIQLESLSNAVELFFIDNGRYPLESEGLQALVQPPNSLATWSGPYIKGTTVPLDPWAKPYRYVTPDRGRSFSVAFTAPNGSPPYSYTVRVKNVGAGTADLSGVGVAGYYSTTAGTWERCRRPTHPSIP